MGAWDGCEGIEIRPYARLADQYTVYSVNRRPGLAHGVTMAEIAAEQAEAIREIGDRPVDVIGLSTGHDAEVACRRGGGQAAGENDVCSERTVPLMLPAEHCADGRMESVRSAQPRGGQLLGGLGERLPRPAPAGA
jgi:hypothetical protein